MKKALPFQEEAIKQMHGKNFLLADDCGLGKTITAIEAARRFSTGPNLVICPRNVKEWWAQELRGQEAGAVHVCGRAGRGVNYEAAKAGDYFVIHPEALRISQDLIAAIHWDWVIADEAHRFKNRRALQTVALQRLVCNKKLAMTATPYGRNPADMWSILHWLYPKKFHSYWKFFEDHVDSYKPRGQKFHKIMGPKNLRYLGRRIAQFYLRRTKDEVGYQLPPLTYVDMPVVVDGPQEQTYLELAKAHYDVFGGSEVVVENALVLLTRLQQCALDPALMTQSEFMFPEGYIPAKLQWLVEWLDDHPEEPVVIVSRYRKFVERWLEPLAEDAMIVGGMKEKEVQEALTNFRLRGRLVGSMQAIAEGLNLQRAATIIVLDGTWSPILEYQLAQRIHRLGQDKPCQVIHLVAKLQSTGRFTVDMLLRRALERRMSEAQLVDHFVKQIREEIPCS